MQVQGFGGLGEMRGHQKRSSLWEKEKHSGTGIKGAAAASVGRLENGGGAR